MKVPVIIVIVAILNYHFSIHSAILIIVRPDMALLCLLRYVGCGKPWIAKDFQ